MIHQPIKLDISGYFDRGIRLMVETTHAREKRDQPAVMWALLCEAAEVSRSWPAPPRSGHPSKSAMPEAPDDLTEWERRNDDFREGVTIAARSSPRTEWSARQHSEAEFTLSLFSATFRLAGARKTLRRATWLYASGMPPRKITALTGLTRHQIQRARERASREMFEALGQLAGVA